MPGGGSGRGRAVEQGGWVSRPGAVQANKLLMGNELAKHRRIGPECQRGKLGYSPHMRRAQLLQSVTLMGGNDIFDDLDLRAFEPEKPFPQAHLPAATVLANGAHRRHALDLLFSVQPDNAFVPGAALLDIAGQQFVEVLQACGVIRQIHAIPRVGTY